mmetsp:Transcript_16384/g.46873  ORF Transcript_16384/g.46873 Transcript_16384/m.46873 type:complete len:221 (-) Transcript_16384:17-679(-)
MPRTGASLGPASRGSPLQPQAASCARAASGTPRESWDSIGAVGRALWPWESGTKERPCPHLPPGPRTRAKGPRNLGSRTGEGSGRPCKLEAVLAAAAQPRDTSASRRAATTAQSLSVHSWRMQVITVSLPRRPASEAKSPSSVSAWYPICVRTAERRGCALLPPCSTIRSASEKRPHASDRLCGQKALATTAPCCMVPSPVQPASTIAPRSAKWPKQVKR